MSGPGPPSSEYVTLASVAHAEIEVKRSRFLAHLERVGSEAEARDVVERARRTHHDARHHCSALVLAGEVGDGVLLPGVRRAHDDGEPSGTAGAPMLDALDAAGLCDVVAVVTRWFGGTLLGTGGLARAYGDAVAAAAAGARRRTRRLVAEVEVGVPIADVGRVEHELRAAGLDVVGTDYAAIATLHLHVTSRDLSAAEAHVAAATSGTARLAVGARRWADVR